MGTLSTYMAKAGDRALPDEVMEKTKQHILDTIAAIVSGATLPAAAIAFRFTALHAAEKVATVVTEARIRVGVSSGSGKRGSARRSRGSLRYADLPR
jgi:2-methylcitrate dehydratase PrpD